MEYKVEEAKDEIRRAIFDATKGLTKGETDKVVDGMISWLTGVKRLGNLDG